MNDKVARLLRAFPGIGQFFPCAAGHHAALFVLNYPDDGGAGRLWRVGFAQITLNGGRVARALSKVAQATHGNAAQVVAVGESGPVAQYRFASQPDVVWLTGLLVTVYVGEALGIPFQCAGGAGEDDLNGLARFDSIGTFDEVDLAEIGQRLFAIYFATSIGYGVNGVCADEGRQFASIDLAGGPFQHLFGLAAVIIGRRVQGHLDVNSVGCLTQSWPILPGRVPLPFNTHGRLEGDDQIMAFFMQCGGQVVDKSGKCFALAAFYSLIIQVCTGVAASGDLSKQRLDIGRLRRGIA